MGAFLHAKTHVAGAHDPNFAQECQTLFRRPDTEQDELVDRALALLGSSCAEGDGDQLLEYIEANATRVALGVEAGSQTAVLFALPLLLEGSAPVELPPDAVRHCEQVLSECDIVSEQADVRLGATLYTADELLAWSWGQVHEMTRALAGRAEAQRKVASAAGGEAVEGLTLRYLLGAAVVLREEVGELFPDFDAQDDDATVDKAEAQEQDEADSSGAPSSTATEEASSGAVASSREVQPYKQPGVDRVGQPWETPLAQALEHAGSLHKLHSAVAPVGFYADLAQGMYVWRYAVALRGVVSILEERSLTTKILRYEIQPLQCPCEEDGVQPPGWILQLITADGRREVAQLEWWGLPGESAQESIAAAREMLFDASLTPMSYLAETVSPRIH